MCVCVCCVCARARARMRVWFCVCMPLDRTSDDFADQISNTYPVLIFSLLVAQNLTLYKVSGGQLLSFSYRHSVHQYVS